MGENWDSRRRTGPSLPLVTWGARAGLPGPWLRETVPRADLPGAGCCFRLLCSVLPGEPPSPPSPDPTAKGSWQVPAQVLRVWIARMLPVASPSPDLPEGTPALGRCEMAEAECLGRKGRDGALGVSVPLGCVTSGKLSDGLNLDVCSSWMGGVASEGDRLLNAVQAHAVQTLGEGSPSGAPGDVSPIPQCGSPAPLLPASPAPPPGGREAAPFSPPCPASGAVPADAGIAPSPLRKPQSAPALPLNPSPPPGSSGLRLLQKKPKHELVAETVSSHSSESLPLRSGTAALSPLDPSLWVRTSSTAVQKGHVCIYVGFDRPGLVVRPADCGREATLPWRQSGHEWLLAD